MILRLSPFLVFAFLVSDFAFPKSEVNVNRPILVNVDAMPVTLEPPMLRDTIANWLLQLLANRLVESEQAGLVRGDLATRWNIEEDGKKYTFHLRDGATFSDGLPVTSKEVVDSLKMTVEHVKSGNLSFYTNCIESVRAVDKLTVEIRLKKRMTGFLQVLGEATFSVYKKCGDRFCYSGPFEVSSQKPKELELVRRTDKQVFRFVELGFDEAEKLFRSGKLDILRTYALTHIKKANSLPNKRLIMRDERSYYVAFNSRSPLFHDRGARLYYRDHLDMSGAAKYLADQGLKLNTSFLAPSFSMGRKELEAVKSAKSNEGRTPSGGVPSLIWIDSHELSPLTETLFKDLPHRSEPLPKAQFLDRVNKSQYDMLIIGYGTTLRDLDAISLFFHSLSMHNFGKVSVPKIDALLESAWHEDNPGKRLGIFSEILNANQSEAFYVTLAHIPLTFVLSDALMYSKAEGETSSEHFLSAPFLELQNIRFKK